MSTRNACPLACIDIACDMEQPHRRRYAQPSPLAARLLQRHILKPSSASPHPGRARSSPSRPSRRLHGTSAGPELTNQGRATPPHQRPASGARNACTCAADNPAAPPPLFLHCSPRVSQCCHTHDQRINSWGLFVGWPRSCLGFARHLRQLCSVARRFPTHGRHTHRETHSALARASGGVVARAEARAPRTMLA